MRSRGRCPDRRRSQQRGRNAAVRTSAASPEIFPLLAYILAFKLLQQMQSADRLSLLRKPGHSGKRQSLQTSNYCFSYLEGLLALFGPTLSGGLRRGRISADENRGWPLQL